MLRSPLLHEVLHANDQLRLQRARGAAFEGYHEGRVRFPPTFKYEPGPGGRYSSRRVPSWTDRILWRAAVGGRREERAGGAGAGSGGGGGAESSSSASGGGGALGAAGAGGASVAGSSGGGTPAGGGGDGEGLGGAVAVRLRYYDSVQAVTSSDHKPVVAGFEVVVGPAVLGLLGSPQEGGGDDLDGGRSGGLVGAVHRGWGACQELCSIM